MRWAAATVESLTSVSAAILAARAGAAWRGRARSGTVAARTPPRRAAGAPRCAAGASRRRICLTGRHKGDFRNRTKWAVNRIGWRWGLATSARVAFCWTCDVCLGLVQTAREKA
jgi:hypothetical protein